MAFAAGLSLAPGKIRGDSHTDPILKFQFALWR
jgi:hypothetical protein